MKPQRFGSLPIDDEFRLGRVLHQNIARACAPQDFVDHPDGVTDDARKTRSITTDDSAYALLLRHNRMRQ
jgi:hypothetical protein